MLRGVIGAGFGFGIGWFWMRTETPFGFGLWFGATAAGLYICAKVLIVGFRHQRLMRERKPILDFWFGEFDRMAAELAAVSQNPLASGTELEAARARFNAAARRLNAELNSPLSAAKK